VEARRWEREVVGRGESGSVGKGEEGSDVKMGEKREDGTRDERSFRRVERFVDGGGGGVGGEEKVLR
jgi:hypothetical protein